MVIAAICLGAIGAVAFATRIRSVPLSPAVILAIGGLTYPLYLLHSTVAAALIPILRDSMPPGVVVVLTAATAIGAAFLVYRFVERPLQRALRPRLEALLGVRRGRRAVKGPAANNADSAVTVW
jgi:peptidoglycan/LPS O-acetylase OafA/YrhL